MSRYVIVLPLSPLQIGDSFPVRSWPLHATIVPSFVSEATPQQLSELLAEFAHHFPPLEVRVLQHELFGLSHTVPVNVLDPVPALLTAHTVLLAALESAFGVAVDSPQFAGEGYRPHVTATTLDRVREGDLVRLEQLAVVDMKPDGPEGGRAVVAIAALGGTEPAHSAGAGSVAPR